MIHRRMDSNRATYDEIGAAYAELNRELPQSVVESMERFLAVVPPDSLVADVGCGPGRDLVELRRRGLRVIGFDLSVGMLRAGGLSGVALADMTRLPVRPGSLDGIWCAAAFLHIPRELSAGTVDGFAQALRPGGRLHLSVAEGEGDQVQPARLGEGRDLFFVQHGEDALRELLRSSGFAITSVHRSQSHRQWLTIGAQGHA